MHGRDEIQEGLLLFLVPTLFFFFSQLVAADRMVVVEVAAVCW